MSSIGQPCERKLYYEVNSPEDAEELRPEVYMKFLFGDLTELLLLFLAEASGHTVEGTQDEQDIVGIKGHRDAVIDGTLVHVSSWYDNEMGYSARCVDLLRHIGQSL